MNKTHHEGRPVPLDNAFLEIKPSIELPAGFYYDDAISCDELVELNNNVGVFGQAYADDILMEHTQRQADQQRLVGTAVRSYRDAKLVGYGLLAAIPNDLRGCTGHLYDLMVDPTVRHKGVGRAITYERVVQADTLGLDSLRVTLSSSNTLRNYYYELGFRDLIQKHTLLRVHQRLAT